MEGYNDLTKRVCFRKQLKPKALERLMRISRILILASFTIFLLGCQKKEETQSSSYQDYKIRKENRRIEQEERQIEEQAKLDTTLNWSFQDSTYSFTWPKDELQEFNKIKTYIQELNRKSSNHHFQELVDVTMDNIVDTCNVEVQIRADHIFVENTILSKLGVVWFDTLSVSFDAIMGMLWPGYEESFYSMLPYSVQYEVENLFLISFLDVKSDSLVPETVRVWNLGFSGVGQHVWDKNTGKFKILWMP